MLEGVEPSVAMTGGPWYTDNELDTEFIDALIKSCLKFIRDMVSCTLVRLPPLTYLLQSFPKRRRTADDDEPEHLLFPISNAPQYPNAQQVLNALKQARISVTELSVEHVEMLLNVLVLDGEVERVSHSGLKYSLTDSFQIPSFGTTLWDTGAMNDSEPEEETERRSKKKRKHRSSDSEESDDEKQKRKRKSKSKSSKRSKRDDSSDSESSDDDTARKKRKRKRAKDVSSEEGSDDSSHKKVTKKQKKSKIDSESETETKGKKKKKKSRKAESGSDNDTMSSASDSDDDDRRRKRKPSKSSSKRSPSPTVVLGFNDFEGTAHVYRAIRHEPLSLGWSQSPCSPCASFDFCKDGGPVNPVECVYYGDWLVGGLVVDMEDVVV